MNLPDVKKYLNDKIREEAGSYFGVKDPKRIDEVVNNWFDDKNNYDGRWKIIRDRVPHSRRILDVAAGCGTFLLYGLQNGYDVWGIEPEGWKREYFNKKIAASGYPSEFRNHMIAGIGECLPFENESFQMVTTYQTLEHVRDVNLCINEMLRVLRPGGILYIRAPDYNGFYEPHYQVPFLPKMNRKIARSYLKMIRKPTLGLQTLQWVNEKDIIKHLRTRHPDIGIERMNRYYFLRRMERIKNLLPGFLRKDFLILFLNSLYEIKLQLDNIISIGRREKNIDLWITKRA